MTELLLGDDGAKKCLAIGIDLGTTYSCVGVFKDNDVQIIANDQGNRTTPSYVAWSGDERLVGDGAKHQVAQNPTNTVFDAKRLIGRRFAEKVVQDDMQHWPYKVVSDGTADDKPLIEVKAHGETRRFHPEEISSMVLIKMKQTAEAFLGERVNQAVVTVPAYFNDSQRQATKDAGEIAGLEVLRIVNEPTAAAIAYGLDAKGNSGDGSETHILIFDMGGGTFDVSVLTLQDTVFEVRATAGDPHLGGEDFDNRMLEFCMEDFKRKNKGADPSKNPRALRRLRTQCERAKRQLSAQTQVTIEVDSFHEGIDFSLRLSRAKFEEINMDYFKKAMLPVTQCMTDSGLAKSEVAQVVLVGGSTRIPKVQELIRDFFDGKELCKDINPDEAVAYGAAVQAAIVSGAGSEEVSKMLLLDVAPLSLGIEMAGGLMKKLIGRNSTIPTNKSEDFTTSDDYQDHVDISVYEGERANVKDNNFLGTFRLEGIPKSLRGVPKIRVTFNIDSNGILEVTALDTKSNVSGDIQISNDKGRLTQDQIEKIVSDAEKFKEQDSLALVEQTARDALQAFMVKSRKALAELDSGKISQADRERFDRVLSQTDQWLGQAGSKAPVHELEAAQKELEAATGTILLRVGRLHRNFWEEEATVSENELLDNGGWKIASGLDLRSIMEDIE